MYDDLKKSMSIPLFVELRAGKMARGVKEQKKGLTFLDCFFIWARDMPIINQNGSFDGIDISDLISIVAHNVYYVKLNFI